MASAKKYILESALFLGLFLALVLPQESLAASLNLTPRSGNFDIDQEITVDVKIDSVGQTINAAQATILFPKDQLEVLRLSKENSVFIFWLKEPKFSNIEGKIEFIGGIQTGVSGGSLQILRIVFRTRGEGSAVVSFEDAAVTANDGSGTNLLNMINGATFTIGRALPLPKPPPSLTPPPPVKRTPVPAQKLPAKPKISIELYPDETAWYNVSSMFLARWELPPDISGMNTALNREANFVPPPVSLELTEGKLFDALRDGIWYLHVRFKNNVGWGETIHYKISIDTIPPTPFTIETSEARASDNPKPRLTFKTSDSLSGINNYSLRIDSGEALEVKEAIYTLPPQPPGKHHISVRAVDRAGNSQEAVTEIDILPIPSPVVTFVSSFLTVGSDERFTANGLGERGNTIHLSLTDRKGQIIASGETKVGDGGDWVFVLDKDLRKGEYAAKVWAEDSRGALSLPIHAGGVIVKEEAVLVLGTVELTGGELILIIVFIGLFGAVAVAYFSQMTRMKRLTRFGLVEYDFSKMVKLLEKDVGELQKKLGAEMDGERLKEESHYLISSLTQTLQKIKTYLAKEIGKLKE